MEFSLLDFVDILRRDIGWLFALSVVFYEILWPYWETKFQTKVTDLLSPLREDITDTQEKVDDIDEKVTEIDKKQVSQTQVTRAISRQIDGIDDEKVDKYLVKNGIQVDEFIIEEDNE